MDLEGTIEMAVVFERAAGRRLRDARQFLSAAPRLAGSALPELEVAFHSAGPLLLAVLRFDRSALTAQVRARTLFWAQECGGACTVLSDRDLRERANFLSRLETAERRTLEALTGPDAPGELTLELDLGDPRRCRWDLETDRLFVVSALPAPIGDVLPLRLLARGSLEPLPARGAVVAVRTPAEASPERPAGMALSLEAPSTAVVVALADLKRAEPLLAQPNLHAERRSAVRRPVSLEVAVSSQALNAAPAMMENVSTDGAFLRSAATGSIGSELGLAVQLPDAAELKVRARVVNVTPDGMGVVFLLTPEQKAKLAPTLSALTVQPPLFSGDRVIHLRYPTADALAPQLQTLRIGGASAPYEPGLELQDIVQVRLELPDGSTHELAAAVVLVGAQTLGLELRPEPKASMSLRAALDGFGPPAAPAGGASQLSVVDFVEDAGGPPDFAASVLSLVDLLEAPVPAAPVQRARPPARLGNYELLSVLGRGGMAEVYYARAVAGPREGRFVAIKRLSPAMAANREAVELFTSEADILSLLRHPNIVETYEVGTFDSQPYLVMEAIDGRDLAQIIRRCRERNIFLPADFACFLVKSVLDALDCAHQSRGPGGAALELVHCDVSPHNVFISRTGEIKLGDFGLAQSLARVGNKKVKVRGKPAYLSPEALDGELSVLADLWAVGVTLYELLTLQQPFPGDTPDEQLKAIRKRRVRSPAELRPELSGPLVELTLRCFEKKPRDRFASAAELAAALVPHFDPNVGTPLAIAAVVRGLFS